MKIKEKMTLVFIFSINIDLINLPSYNSIKKKLNYTPSQLHPQNYNYIKINTAVTVQLKAALLQLPSWGKMCVKAGASSCSASVSPHGWHTASEKLSACWHTLIHTLTLTLYPQQVSPNEGWRRQTSVSFLLFQPLYDGHKRSGHRGFNTQAPGPMSPAQPGLFCEPVLGIELSLVVGAKEDYARMLGVRRWLVADQADDLWESPMAFLLG